MTDAQRMDRPVVPRGPGGKWLPGYAPNPGGRPKSSYAVSDLAKQHTPEALATLVEIMQDKAAPAAARVSAAEALLNRAWGKPVQAIDARVETVDFGAMHLAALTALARAGQGDAATIVEAVEVAPAGQIVNVPLSDTQAAVPSVRF
jgi:hypothetical protein